MHSGRRKLDAPCPGSAGWRCETHRRRGVRARPAQRDRPKRPSLRAGELFSSAFVVESELERGRRTAKYKGTNESGRAVRWVELVEDRLCRKPTAAVGRPGRNDDGHEELSEASEEARDAKPRTRGQRESEREARPRARAGRSAASPVRPRRAQERRESANERVRRTEP